MESLTQTLRAQHRLVEKVAAEVDRAVATGDREAIRALLAQLGPALTAHLKLEDARLYPEIEQRAKATRQESLIRISASFSASMLSISQVLTRFLERYQKPGWELANFGREWRNIASTLKTRIQTEETSLYPLYDRLTAHSTDAGKPMVS